MIENMDYSNKQMAGKTCMITGATAGIGMHTAERLAEMGARVIVVGRNPVKTVSTAMDIRERTGNPDVDTLVADLSNQAQIRRLVGEFIARYDRLDVLVNNAGGFFLWRQNSIDNIEMTFALNHLNYFLLTNLLLDILQETALKETEARVVNVSSTGHIGKRLDFDDLEMKRRYHPMQAYGRSKLANILFTKELSRRFADSGVTANALHPGWVATDIGKNNGLLVRSLLPLLQWNAMSPQEGAQTSIYLASNPVVKGVSGEYFVDCRVSEPDPAALDLKAAERLWEISAEMTSLSRENL